MGVFREKVFSKSCMTSVKQAIVPVLHNDHLCCFGMGQALSDNTESKQPRMSFSAIFIFMIKSLMCPTWFIVQECFQLCEELQLFKCPDFRVILVCCLF